MKYSVLNYVFPATFILSRKVDFLLYSVNEDMPRKKKICISLHNVEHVSLKGQCFSSYFHNVEHVSLKGQCFSSQCGTCFIKGTV